MAEVRDDYFDKEIEEIFKLFYENQDLELKVFTIIKDLYSIYQKIIKKAKEREYDMSIFFKFGFSGKRFYKDFALKWVNEKKVIGAQEEKDFIENKLLKIPSRNIMNLSGFINSKTCTRQILYTIFIILPSIFEYQDIITDSDLEIAESFNMLGIKNYKYILKLLSPYNNYYGLRLVRREYYKWEYE